MPIRLKLKSFTPAIDEAAKWRSTSFNTELTGDEIERLVAKYGADVLCAHYDNGVPTGKDPTVDSSGVSKPYVPARGKEPVTPQSTFNPHAEWNTPVGIYYYPLSWAADKLMAGPSKIPFAAEAKYIYIYKIKDPSKRLDVSDIPYNGFIEEVVYELAKSGKNFIEVLNLSGVKEPAIEDISQVYFGGSTGLTKEIMADRIRRLFLHFADEQYNTLYNVIFGRVSRGLADQDVSYSYDQLIAMIANALSDYNDPLMPETGLPDYTNAVISVWHPPIRAMLDEMGIKKLFYETYGLVKSDEYKKNPNFRAELAGKFQNLNGEYLESKREFLDSPMLNIVSDLAVPKPPPPNTIAAILKKHGMDEHITGLTCYYILNNFNERKPARVTKYLLSKGFDVIEDTKGLGAIHEQERFQGIFLRTAAAQLVGVYLNRFRANRGKAVHIDPKEMNPAKLRGLLSLPDGEKLINRALEFAKKNPKETSMFLQYIFNNTNITKNKALADKIANNVDPNSLNNLAITGYIKSFAGSLTPDELEKVLSKLVSDKIKTSLPIEARGTDASKITTAFNEAFDEIKSKYGDKFTFDKYPTLKFLKDSRDAAAEQSYAEDVVSNLKVYSVDDIKKAFPIALKQKNPEGQLIEFATAVSNVVESIDFKNKPIEDRMEFSEWLFDTYPQAWKDDAAIRSCLSAMRYVRAEDDVTPEAEEEYIQKRRAGFYHKLLVHWEDMKADPKLLDKLAKEKAAINKKYGVTTESRFKKLNRIGNRWSRFG